MLANEFTAFILAKDEEPNIRKCVGALRAAGARVIVLDSGSSDLTRESAYDAGAEVKSYQYKNHCAAYNDITKDFVAREDAAFVIDADMVVSPPLATEAIELLNCGADVVSAPVVMWWGGAPLLKGSLYPPKPFLFRGGAQYFEPRGHAEVLVTGTRVNLTRNKLVHDDRKDYSAYLLSQLRYARAILARSSGKQSFRDVVRTSTPLLIAVAPLISYLARGGITSGRTGALYAVDRLIAEAIMYRESLAKSIQNKPDPHWCATSHIPRAPV